MTRTQYVAGWNMPGYLGETEPETFDTFEDARGYVEDALVRFMDEDDAADDATPTPDTDGRSYWSVYYAGLHLWVETYAPLMGSADEPFMTRCSTDATSADECHFIREREAAARHDPVIPACPKHGEHPDDTIEARFDAAGIEKFPAWVEAAR